MRPWQLVVVRAVEDLAIFIGLVVLMAIGVFIMVNHPTWWGIAWGFCICVISGALSVVWGADLATWVWAQQRQRRLKRNQRKYEEWLGAQRILRDKIRQRFVEELAQDDERVA